MEFCVACHQTQKNQYKKKEHEVQESSVFEVLR